MGDDGDTDLREELGGWFEGWAQIARRMAPLKERLKVALAARPLT